MVNEQILAGLKIDAKKIKSMNLGERRIFFEDKTDSQVHGGKAQMYACRQNIKIRTTKVLIVLPQTEEIFAGVIVHRID